VETELKKMQEKRASKEPDEAVTPFQG